MQNDSAELFDQDIPTKESGLSEAEWEPTQNTMVERAHHPAALAPSTFQRGQWLNLLVFVSTGLALLLAIAALIAVMQLIGHTLLLFSLGALVAYALAPLVGFVQHANRKKPRPLWLSILVVFVVLFALAGAGATLLGSTLTDQVSSVVTNHTQLEANGRALIANADKWMNARGLPVSVSQFVDHPPPVLKAWESGAAKIGLTFLEGLSTVAAESVIVLLIALYLLIYSEDMKTRINAALPIRLRPYAEQWESDVNRILGGFVLGNLILALATGIFAAIGCALLGLPTWLLIGVFVTFVSLIPVFGPYLGAIPALAAAALTPAGAMSPTVRLVAVLILFIVLNEAGSKILYPRLVGAALGMHEVLVLFVLFAGFEVSHIWGVLFAAPVTAIAIATVAQLYQLWQGQPPIVLRGEKNESKKDEVKAVAASAAVG